MGDCSQHKKDIAGISDMKVLAEMIGDLHYEPFAELLKHLELKLWKDGQKDINNGREKIGNILLDASWCIDEASQFIESAWQISRPFMEKPK